MLFTHTAVFHQIFNFGAPIPIAFSDQSQIWCARVDPGVLFYAIVTSVYHGLHGVVVKIVGMSKFRPPGAPKPLNGF